MNTTRPIETTPLRKRHGSYRLLLLVLLLALLLAGIFCAAQYSLNGVKPDRLNVVVEPQETADYGPWPWVQVRPVDPVLATLVVQERATEIAQTPQDQRATPFPTLTSQVALLPSPDSNGSDPALTPVAVAASSTPPSGALEEMTNTPDSVQMPNVAPSATAPYTPVATNTPAATATPGNTATPEATSTATITLTATRATVTPTNTMLPTATRTPTATLTVTPIPSNTLVLTATPAAPVAGFYPAPASGNAPLTVAFINTSSGLITSYAWNFGDGSGGSNLINPSYTYTNPGTYTVTLTVYGPGGSSLTNQVITVNTPAPVAGFFALPNSGTVPLNVNFTNTSSGAISSYAWNFGDGAGFSSAINPSYTYSIPGTYTVTLTVNGPGGSAFVSATIIVIPPPPTSTATWTRTPTRTYTPTPTRTTTLTSTPTATYTSTPTYTPSVTHTPTVTYTPSLTNTPVPVAADLALSIGVDNPTPAEAAVVTYTITLTNNGPSPATGISVTDLLPGGVTYVAHTAGQGTYTPGTGVWNVGNLANGATVQLQIDVTINIGTGGTTIPNPAAITAVVETDPDGMNNSDSVSLTVSAPANLLLTAMCTFDPLTTRRWRVRNTNLYPITFDWIVLSTSQIGVDVVPAAVGAVPGEVFFTTSVPPANQTAQISVGGVPHDTQASNSTACVNVDLQLSKSASTTTPNEGDAVNFTITLTNSGPDNGTGIQVSDVLPAGLTLTGSSASQGSYAGGVWTVGPLAASNSAILIINTTVNSGTGGSSITNTALISAAGEYDPVPGNNSASAMLNVQVPPLLTDLIMNSKTVDNASPLEGNTIRYTVSVMNLGPDNATGIIVNDMLPAGLTYVSHTAWIGSYNPVTGNWDVGALANGASGTLDIQAQVNAGTAGSTITNTASITAYDQIDPNLLNNSISRPITVQIPSADLGLTKTVDNPIPAVGQMATFTVTITNAGPNTATGIQVYDPLPAGLTSFGQSVTIGGYSGLTGIWSIGSLGPGSSGTLTLRAVPNAGTGGAVITNLAQVTASSAADPVAGNNSASASITVQGAPIAQSDSVNTALGVAVAVNVLANDSDPNSNINPASVNVIVGPSNGTIDSINPATGAITYRPNPSFSGLDSFLYQVCDTTSLCASASVSVAVAPGEEIIIDNLDGGRVAITGAWVTSINVPQYYASDYIHDDNLDKGTKSVTFSPALAGGTYAVYVWWTEHTNRATNVPIEVNYGAGTSTLSVNQQANGGQWNQIGIWIFTAGPGPYVRVRTDGTNGFVVADAVRFVQVSNP